MILRITKLQVVRPHLLRLTFNDGAQKTVEALHELNAIEEARVA
jgi:hypothetical protein